MPLEWFVEDTIRKGNVDQAAQLSRSVSLFYLRQDHPEVYEMLMDMERRVQERAMQPPQIGQVVMQSPQIHGAMYDISGNENVNLGGKK